MDKKILLKKVISYFYNGNIPDSLEEMRNLWNELFCNIDISNIPSDILDTEDKLLRLELLNTGLTNAEKLDINDFIKKSNLSNKNKICIWKGDITKIYADIVVNPINYLDYIEGNIVNEMFLKGGIRLLKKFKDISINSSLDNADILITRGYNIPCDLLIHILISKINSKLDEKDIINIKMAYRNGLECANNNMMKTVVIPSIGLFGEHVNKEYAKLVLEIISEYLDKKSTIEKIIISVSNDEDYNTYKEVVEGEYYA